MRTQRALSLSFCLGFVITSVAIALLPPVIIPQGQQPDSFWYMVLWTEVLNAMLWASMAFFASAPLTKRESSSHWGGVAATISIVTATYAICSFLAMFAHTFIFHGAFSSRLHWAVQIIFFTVAALAIVFLSISRLAQSADFADPANKIPAPRELHDLLGFHESLLRGPSAGSLRGNVKQLRETVLYSLHDSLLLSQLSEYQQLATEIVELCHALNKVPDTEHHTKDADHIVSLNESVLVLRAKVETVSAKHIRS